MTEDPDTSQGRAAKFVKQWNARGEILKRLRLDRGLTQRELAEMIGTSQGYVSKVEKNETFPNLTKWAAAFEMSLADLHCRLFGYTNATEQAIQADPLLSNEQRRALLVIYGSLTSRDSLAFASADLSMNKVHLKSLEETEEILSTLV